MSRPSDVWVENVPTSGVRWPDLRELWYFRELFVVFALRDLRVRYAQAQLGALWAVFQPLIGVVAFTLVFDRLADVPSDGIPYPLFAYLGLTAWTYVSRTMTTATQSLADNLGLVTKVYLPRLVPPVAAALPGLVDLGLALIIAVPFALIVGAPVSAALLTTPLWVLLAVGAGLGIGLLLCTVNVRFRDVRQVIGLLVQLGLFASPIAYPTSVVPDAWRLLYALNPVVAPVEGLRFALGGGPFPAADVLLLSIASNVGLILLGLLVFSRAERRFADVI